MTAVSLFAAENARNVVAVTGASGFIGSRLVTHLLEAGCRVVALARHLDEDWARQVAGDDAVLSSRLEMVRVDASRADAMAATLSDCRALVHLAECQPHLDDGEGIDLFVRSTQLSLAVAQAAAKSGVASVVWASSALVYGTSREGLLSEDLSLEPGTPYAAAKAAGEWIAFGAAKSAGQTLTIARIFNCYGPGQSDRTFLGKLIAEARAGGEVYLQHLRGARDFVHVDDVVRALAAAVSRPAGPPLTINVGSGVSTPLSAAAALVETLGRSVRISVADNAEETARASLMADIRRARAALGWSPQRSLEKGVKELLQSTSADHRDRPVPTLSATSKES